MRSNEVRVDSRGHISLNFRKNKQHTIFLWEEDPDGAIHLYPAMLVPAKLMPPDPSPPAALHRSRDPMEVLREYFPDAKEMP